MPCIEARHAADDISPDFVKRNADGHITSPVFRERQRLTLLRQHELWLRERKSQRHRS